MTPPPGVLPDDVIKDPNSQGLLAFLTLDPAMTSWAIGGTYFTYMKIQQHLDAPAGLGGDNAMEAAIGRRKVDGSRLDQPEAMNPLDEPDYSAAQQPALTSHIRKAGPRGTEQSDPGDVFLFRRGLPFTGAPDGHLVAGLQFVSFSRSLDFVDVVWNHWMMNPGFPADGTGIDQLFQPALTTVLASGFFFVPPDDSRFTGAGIFLGPEHALAHQAKVVVRKVILAQDGSVAIKPLKGFGFTVFDQASNTAVSSEFKTNSAGHAVSPELPTGKPLVLRETANPLGGLGLPTGPDVNFGPLDPSGPPPAIKFPNQFPAPHQPGYG